MVNVTFKGLSAGEVDVLHDWFVANGIDCEDFRIDFEDSFVDQDGNLIIEVKTGDSDFNTKFSDWPEFD